MAGLAIKRWRVATNALNWLVFSTVIAWFVSALFSLDPRMSLEALWLPLTHLTIFFIFVDLIQRGRQRLIFEAQFLLAAVVVLMAGMQFISWFFGLGFVPGTRIGWIQVLTPQSPLPLVPPKLYMPLGVSTWLAAYTAPLVIVLVGWAMTMRRRDYRIAIWVLASAVFFIMLMTFSRGGIISIAASATVFGGLQLVQRFDVRQLTLKRTLPFVVAGILVVVGAGSGILFLSRNEGHAAGDELRRDLWNSAFGATRDYPVMGVGPGLFARAYRQYRNPEFVDDRLSSSHNFYLNTAAETGIVGLVICGGLGFVILRTWWGLWRNAVGGRKVRLAATFAALVGLGVQSFFDMFVMTPIALLILLLVAYCITEPGKRLPRSRVLRLATVGLVILLMGFGVGLLQSDWAMATFSHSLDGDIAAAQEAHTIDPTIRLYELQIAYLSTASTDMADSIDEYERVLTLEPTWDTGWINLAALHEQTGDFDAALGDLERAFAINHGNVGALNWSRIAEENHLADDTAIVDRYVTALRYHQWPGMADFWWETPLRQQAVEQYLSGAELDAQYRVYWAHDPLKAYALVPSNPATAPEWWVKGEYTLTVGQNARDALVAFGEAISHARTTGDYYAARARAAIAAGEMEMAKRDLDIAQLLGTVWEFPNSVRIQLASSTDEVHELRVDALPPRIIDQNFEGVLYGGRVAGFELVPSMRSPGPGHAAMQPWYDLAQEYLNDGLVDRALNVYRAILDFAPDEATAHRLLNQLSSVGQGA
ncbi:MAG: O-antigen ligase family protein [Anaerolineae bacterium]